MKLHVNRRGVLRIKDQIKQQIRMLIDSGALSLGQPLPSAKDMAQMLSVNRNTVANAYRELVADGCLRAVVGKGTFVTEKAVKTSMKELAVIFEEAFGNAVRCGFTRDQIEDFLLSGLTQYFSDIEGGRVVVVECNQEAIENISLALRNELGVETVALLIQKLKVNPDLVSKAVLSSVDLVVCGFNHVEEFQRICPDCPAEMVAVMTRADVRIISELTRLPPGTKVGFSCANQLSAETFFKELMLSGGSGLIKIWAGLDDRCELKKLMDQCQVILANSSVYDRILEMVGPEQRVIKIESNIDRSNIELIRERLTVARIRRKRLRNAVERTHP
jgi:DNA-binding transcriptional regulator YhcF (GntR family)